MSGYGCCSDFVILPVRIHLTACFVFWLFMIFLLKLFGLKISFHSSSGLGQVFSYFRAHCEPKKKKVDPFHESVQNLHFSTWPKLEAIFSQIKGSSHEINLLCDRKYKHEVEENRKVLVPIIDTIVTLRRLGLPFRGYRDDSKYNPKVGEYSTGGVSNFVEFLQLRIRDGDRWRLEQHLNTCRKNGSFSKTSQNDLIRSCRQFFAELVVRKIKENQFLSILEDEAFDGFNQEQLSLVIRYVNSFLSPDKRY